MFDNLPLHIRETIFSRVRYMDLFETARVSQGWWALTMASFERFLHKEDDFLLDQVDFCNQMMPKEKPWEWWMFMEFTKSEALHLKISEFHALISNGKGRLIRYFSSKQIHVKDLKVGESKSFLSHEVLRLPPNLNDIFPCLTSLDVEAMALESHSTIVFPLHLTSLRFGLLRMPSTDLISLNTSDLKVLDLKKCGFESFYLLDALKFDNLTHLSASDGWFNMTMQSSSTHKRILKNVLHDNKKLKSVSFRYAYITKEWLQIFPSNVVEIHLFEPRLKRNLAKLFGNNVFYERLLLMYICEDWTSVVEFKTNSMSWEKYQEEEVDEDDENDDDEESSESYDYNDFENAYQVNYMCKPTANEEAIFVKHRKVAINELISKNNQGLFLTKLMYYHHAYEVPIPANVRYLSILSDNENNESDESYESDDDIERQVQKRPCGYHLDYDDYELVLEDPTALQTLNGCQKGFKNRLATVPNMIYLRELDIFECDKNLVVSILRSCTSLSKLTLNCPVFCTFGKMSADIKSLSLKCLTIIYGSDTFQDILKPFPSLNSLTLERPCRESVLKSDVNAIKGLHYFKVVMQGDKETAVHLSTLQFPYMLFVVNRELHSYTASKGFELVNELSPQVLKKNIPKARGSSVLYVSSVPHKAVSLVYARNIATRFMRNSGDLVVTVQDFIDKLQSAKYN